MLDDNSDIEELVKCTHIVGRVHSRATFLMQHRSKDHPPLWGKRGEIRRVLILTLAALPIGTPFFNIIFMLMGINVMSTIDSIVIGIGWVGVILGVIHIIRRGAIRWRTRQIGFQDATEMDHPPEGADDMVSSAVRSAIGHAYGVNPCIIRPSDGECDLWWFYPVWYGPLIHEVVLDIGYVLGLSASDVALLVAKCQEAKLRSVADLEKCVSEQICGRERKKGLR